MIKTARHIFNIHLRELPFAALMGFQFFLVIGTFWILKPLKKTLFIEHYDLQHFSFLGHKFNAAQTELLAKNLNMLVAFIALGIFIGLAKKHRRHVLFILLSAVVFICAIGVHVWLQFKTASSIWAFYIFGDLFNMLMVGGFFAFLNDSVSKAQAKRLFGIIILGGVLGGAIGASTIRGLLDTFSLPTWLHICAGITVIIAILAIITARYIKRHSHLWQCSNETTPLPAPTQTLRKLFTSKYVLALVTIVGGYEIVSSIVDFQFSAAVSHYLDGAKIGVFFTNVYLVVNIVSLSVQLLLTSFVMTRFGITKSLLVLPVALMAGSLTLVAVPLLLISAFLCVCDNGLNYSINQSAKESLYVILPNDSKYKTKALVDILTQRTAKAMAINVTLLLSALMSFRWLAIASICFIVIWMFAAVYAGQQFDNDGNKKITWPKKARKKHLIKKPKLFPIVPL